MNYINEGLDYIYKYTLSMRLVVATDNGDLNEIKNLLKKGADVNTTGVQGWTNLMWSSYHSNTTSSIEIVKIFLESGANVNAKNDLGWTSLMWSSYHSNTTSSYKTVKLLLKYGADINIQNNLGTTSLMFSSANSNTSSLYETVKLLLDNEADPNIQNNLKNTSLMYASQNSNTSSSYETVKLLLDNEADPNIQDILGNTSLMISSANSNTSSSYETVKLLLKYGADPFVKNNKGEYPLDVCETEKCKELISKSMWKIMYGNIKLKSSKLKSRKIPKEIWELILLRNKQKALCKDLSKPENKYILLGFAQMLNIPVNVNMNKRDLCTIISKQISYGEKYRTESVLYMKKNENKEIILNIAKSLGINTNQPINKIIRSISIKSPIFGTLGS